MRITAIIKDSTSYGGKKDVILTSGASTEIGTHYFAGALFNELSTSKNDIVIAGGEPLDQMYLLQTFLELVRYKSDKKIHLVTKRKVIPTKRVWQFLAQYVDIVEEYTSGQIIDLKKSVRRADVVLWEDSNDEVQ